jgi:hypothetical protein
VSADVGTNVGMVSSARVFMIAVWLAGVGEFM